MNNKSNGVIMKNDIIQDDLVAAGFHRLDPHLVDMRPKKGIAWGKKYKAKTLEEKVVYLEKFCASMNDAAFRVSGERDALNTAIKLKERQLIAVSKQLDQNNAMIQTQITQMNSERQGYRDTISTLDKKVKVLEDGCND